MPHTRAIRAWSPFLARPLSLALGDQDSLLDQKSVGSEPRGILARSHSETYPIALRHQSSIPFCSILALNSFTVSTSSKSKLSLAGLKAFPAKIAVGETSW